MSVSVGHLSRDVSLKSGPFLAPTSPAAAPPLARPAQKRPPVPEAQSSVARRGYIRVEGTPSTRTVYLEKNLSLKGSFPTIVQATNRMLVGIVPRAPPHRIRLLVCLFLGVTRLMASGLRVGVEYRETNLVGA